LEIIAMDKSILKDIEEANKETFVMKNGSVYKK